MANDNVIDELSLKIDASADSAIRNLSKMQSQLRNLARDIGRVSAATSSLTSLTKAFSTINSVNTNKLSTTVNELDRLSKINLKNLDGKTVNLDIKLSGADVKERMKYAMDDAAKGIDGSKISKALNDALGFKGETAAKIRKGINEAIATAGNGGDFERAFNNVVNTIDKHNGEIYLKQSAYDEFFATTEREYKELLDYFRSHPIKLTSEFDKKTFNESTSPWERKGFFNQKRGSEIQGRWEEVVGMFPTILSNYAALTDEEEQVATVLGTIREAMSGVTRESIGNVKGAEQQQNAWQHVMDSISNARQTIETQMQSGIDKSMRESANKVPLDINVDIDRIEKQIAEAVAKASKKKYELPIEFDLKPFETNFRTSINSIVSGVDVKNMGAFTESIQQTATAMASIGATDFNENGVTRLVNSLKRLAEVDTSKFNAETFGSMVSGISSVANIGDISTGINRLISALARLANAGDKAKATADSLPALGEAIKSVSGGLSSMGGLPAELNAFVSSIAQLANAGNKTGATAEQLRGLGEAVKAFISDLSNAPEVSNNVVQLATAMGQLAQSGGKAGTAAKGISRAISDSTKGSETAANRITAIKKIFTDLESVFKRVASTIKSHGSRIVSSFMSIRTAGINLNSATASIKNMIGAMIGFRGVQGLVNLGKQVLTLGANMTEIDHIVESVFGDMAQYVDAWSKEAISKFGIAEHSAKQYAGTMSSMFQASGVGYRDAGKMGMDLTELAGDLSAFYNIDTETAFNKIRSGMAGMVRPLRDLGIDLTAATLQEYAQAKGIQTKYNAMTQAEKVMLRYNYLMDNTRTQQGDFVRTQYSMANALRTLKANLAAVGTQLGIGFASALRHVVVWLNEMMKYINKAATAFATFMQTIFGKYKGGASGIAMDMSGAEEPTSNLEDAAGGVASGLEDADDAAKKLKKDLAVLPLDELNQLTKDKESSSSSNGSGGTGAGGALGDVADGLLDWGDLLENSEAGKLPEKISEWAKRCKEAFKKGDWKLLGEELASGINDGIKKVYDALDINKFKEKVDPFLTGFTQTFNSLIKNVDWDLLGKTVGEAINNIVYAVNRLLTEIDWVQIGKSFADFANGLVKKVNFTQIGKMFGQKFMVLWKTLYGFAQDFDWAEFGKKLGAGINGLNEAISWTTIAKALATSINGLFTSLKNFTKTVKWDEVAKNITDGINTFIKTFHWKENGEALGNFISDLCDTLITIIEETNWEDFGKGLAEMLSKIPWSKILKVVGEAIVKGLGGILDGLASTPAGSFASAFIKALIAFKIGSALLPFANSIIQAFTGKSVGTLLATGATSLMTTFAGKISAGFPMIATAVSTGFSSIVSGISTAVTAIGGALAAIGPTGWIIIGVIAGVAALTTFVVTHWDDIKKAAGKLKDGIVKAWESLKNFTKTTFDTIKTNVGNAWDAVKTKTTSIYDSVKTKVTDVWGKIETKATTVAGSVLSKVSTAWENVKNKTSDAFGTAKDKVVTAFGDIATKVKEVAPDAFKTISTNWKNIKSVTTTEFDAIGQKAKRVWGDVKTTVDTAITAISTKMSSAFETAASRFKSTLDSIGEKASKKFESIKGAVDSAFSSLKSTFGTKWSLDIANNKPHIPVPHFEKTGSFSLNPPSIPSYRFAGWWKKGGLFKGGSGSLIGVAEGGRDEAVLPLENNKAMATIGNAIANASDGNIGISKDDITDAVVMAMAMNPQSQEIIVNAVLKMENDEVLARHVERGRRQIDSRYNPVAQY